MAQSSSKQIPIKILRAHRSDFPTMARLCAEAMSVDLIHRVLYPTANLLDSSLQEVQLIKELEHDAAPPTQAAPKVHIWKAVSGTSNDLDADVASEPVPTEHPDDILGWVLFRINEEQKGEEDVELGGAPQVASDAPASSVAFLSRLGGEFTDAIAKHIGQKSHIYCNPLLIRPQSQGQGIGSRLLQYGLEKLGADKVPTLIITQARINEYYHQFGFNDVRIVDVDLADYMGRRKGYGMHRSNVMIRPPGDASSKTP